VLDDGMRSLYGNLKEKVADAFSDQSKWLLTVKFFLPSFKAEASNLSPLLFWLFLFTALPVDVDFSR
jgi:hypothetical protein